MTTEEKEILREKQRKSGQEIGKKNLITFDKLDKDTHTEIARKGAMATNEIRRKKKNIKHICNELLNINALDIAQGIIDSELLQKLKENEIDLTLYDLVVIKQIENAIANKSTKSAEFLRDSSGDKPTEKTETTIDIMTDSDRQLIEMLSDRIEVLEGIADGKIVDNE